MDVEEAEKAIQELDRHFAFIRPYGDQPASIKQIFEECHTWLALEPERTAGVVIDPWNELEHMRPEWMSET
jgi:hypothetical protein